MLYEHLTIFSQVNRYVGINAGQFKSRGNYKAGICKVDGCNEVFYGPHNRKYCDKHSGSVRQTGRAMEYSRYKEEKEQKINEWLKQNSTK